MIDKVNLNRLIGQVLETEKRVRKKETGEVGEIRGKEDIVQISDAVRKSLETDYEDITEKVKKIKEEIAKGTYEVSPEKIVEGFKKFFY